MRSDPKHKRKLKRTMRVTIITLIVNILLATGKLITGILANSGALLSDAVHSYSDVLSTLVVIVGLALSMQKADKGHPYGHEKLESIAALVLSGMLFLTAVLIAIESVRGWLAGGTIKTPGIAALIVAIISILTKEWMYHYTKAEARRINSDALNADAWHHRSDAASSIGSALGILGARLGFPILEPIAVIVIAGMILKTAVDIFREATNKLVDKALPTEEEEQMRRRALEVDGVRRITGFKSRLFGSRAYVDISIGVAPEMSICEAHEIAEAVHDALEEDFPNLKHCMVHEEPDV